MTRDELTKMGFVEDIPNRSWKLHFPIINITFLYVYSGASGKSYYEYITKDHHGDCHTEEIFIKSINKTISLERDLKLQTIGIV